MPVLLAALDSLHCWVLVEQPPAVCVLGCWLQDVQAAPQWVCAGCQGKRMRAPSQAAIQAAIEAAREREEAEEAAAGRAPKRARLAAGAAGAGGVPGVPVAARSAGSWADAAMRVLTKVR